MALVIYNSLTNKMEEFTPHSSGKVNMYVCGPTVYNYIHIGNARPIIFFDMVKRYLEFLGYTVIYATNITDVDDKIIKQAISENASEEEISSRYIKAFFEDLEKTGSTMPNIIPYATKYVSSMIDFIGELIEKEYAYMVDGDVYFRINKLPSYGILSNQNQEDLDVGVRINPNEKKENPLDFTLWKKTKEGVKWDSPFGKGRPGWHTECVVMNREIFKTEIDIHGGGMDLKFPHHENEIAQAKAIYNNNVAKYFMHVARLHMNGETMSKSLGNGIFVHDINDNEELMALRLLIICAPYRSEINYNSELASYYLGEYEKISRCFRQSRFILDYYEINTNEECESDVLEFKEYMNQDFNTPNVLMLINRIIKEINNLIRRELLSEAAIKANTLKIILNVLGIKINYEKFSIEDKDLYKNWLLARENKDYEKADYYRKLLTQKGRL